MSICRWIEKEREKETEVCVRMIPGFLVFFLLNRWLNFIVNKRTVKKKKTQPILLRNNEVIHFRPWDLGVFNKPKRNY